jgi:hypothetical protein
VTSPLGRCIIGIDSLLSFSCVPLHLARSIRYGNTHSSLSLVKMNQDRFWLPLPQVPQERLAQSGLGFLSFHAPLVPSMDIHRATILKQSSPFTFVPLFFYCLLQFLDDQVLLEKQGHYHRFLRKRLSLGIDQFSVPVAEPEHSPYAQSRLHVQYS